MIKVVQTMNDLCTGCNRCVRECPMETANITYQDEAGNIKVKIDHDKCIACGRCVSACKHDARYFVDDTERFFNDLQNGIPISLIAAPSIRTNIPGYKKLFTYLKQLGVNKIYDVSLGGDICIWAHIKYIERNGPTPLITQPCPVVVTYCEIYRHDLLKRLSPVHSPMACTSIYMKKYQGINDRIAALSPCMAKANEFEDTGLMQYSITFSKLLEYLKKNNIVIPDKETEFDHDETGLGVLFPMPGGLKENIEYFIGKKLYISKAEGFSIYEKLNQYAKTTNDFLPEIYDVLNCIEGCNTGSASSHDKSVFEIAKTMNNRRNVAENRKSDHCKSVYKTYDDTLELSYFIRKYQPVSVSFPQISNTDINKAFELLGKTDYKKQNVDCGACGSETCHEMARKIALNVNIPVNCIVKSMENAKTEHEINIRTHEQLTEMEKTRVTDERLRIEADAANKAKSTFLSTMSHEIRTPMNAILGIAEIQLQNETLSPDVKEAIGKIYASSDMLLGIINDILDLSKIEAGKLELLVNKYEIASLLSDTAQLNIMRIGSKQIAFEFNVDENTPTHLSGDELRVKQILNNLLSNAFKYTAAGSVNLSITVETCERDDMVVLVITVSDTGQGMTEEQVKKLFDEYARFNHEANRVTEGTGLGMSITQNLVRLMNGEISVESEPGKGSTFTVRLPQGRSGAGVLGKELAENLNQFRTHNRAQMKRVQISREPMPYGNVLIVDDVGTNIYVAKGLMLPYELNIDSADSGFAAIEKIKNGKVYDIVFMDHMMPKMDGIETVKILRGMGYEHPIVALTANAVMGQAEVFFENGFDDYISKPIDIRQLNIVLNKLIRDKQPPEIIETARRRSDEKKGPSHGCSAPEPAINPVYAEIFARDAKKSLAALDDIIGKGGPCDDDDLRTYIIHVHGMKSSLANVNKMDLSAAALKLEQSAREGNIKVIAYETPAFINSLRTFVEELIPEKETDGGEEIDNTEEDRLYLRDKLLAMIAACQAYDERKVDEILKGLKNTTWPRPMKELLDTFSEYLLHSDFDEIVDAANRYLYSHRF